MKKRFAMAATLAALWSPSFLSAQELPRGWVAKNVVPVGYSTLGGRPAFKLSIKEHRGRWYLFTSHFWHHGWSVVDVTDPAKPFVAKFLAGPKNTATWQVDIAGNTLITGLEKRTKFPNFGGDPKKPQPEGVLIWDISNPLQPRLKGRYATGGTGTHRNFYAGGRFMHLAAGMPGYKGNIYVIVDIANPAKPREVGRWWVKGQHAAGGEKLAQGADTDPKGTHSDTSHENSICGTDADVSLHGPPYVVGKRAYLPYGSAGFIILDIANPRKPRQIGRLDFSPPFHSRFGVHGVLPLPQKGIAYMNSENVTYGKGPLHHASIVDISNPVKPVLLSLFPQPVPPAGATYRNFWEKGGWVGPHNINQLQHNPSVERQGNRFYIAHFNAGLRIYDVSDHRMPTETGFFLPPDPRKRYGTMPQGKLVTQTEDVLVDRRGFIYITDKNQGLWIVKATAPQGKTGKRS